MRGPASGSASSPTRVGLYTRVSTDMQAMADEGSLDTQEQRLRSAVAARAGAHEVIEVFREEGASGKSLDRPALRRLMRSVEGGSVDLVLVTRIDRLSRSLVDFFELYRLFERHGVELYSLNEAFDTSTPMGRAMLKLILVFAELEREQTADRTKVAMLARAQRGIWNGGHPVLGYVSDGSGHLSIDEAEAAVVRAAFERVLEVRSPAEVAAWLNAQGYRQKRYQSRRRGDVGDRPFTIPVVRHLLQDRRYLGEIPFGGEWFPGQHPPIVDALTFERVQGILDDNRNGARPPSVVKEHHFLLTGLVRCGSCSRALTSGTAQGRDKVRYPYYRCTSTTKRVDLACTVRNLPAAPLEEAVLGVIRAAARDPALVRQAAAEAERIAREELEPATRRIDALRRELAQVKRDGEKLLDALVAAGVKDVGPARDRLQELDGRRQQLEQALAEEEGRLSVADAQRLDFELVVQALRDFDAAYHHLTPVERREFLQQMVDSVVVHPDRVEVALYEGTQASVNIQEALRLHRKKGGAKRGGGSGESANDAGELVPVGPDSNSTGARRRRAVHAVHAAVHADGEAARTPEEAGDLEGAVKERFAAEVDWLRRRDSNPRPGG